MSRPIESPRRPLAALLLAAALCFPPVASGAAAEWIYVVRPGDNLWDFAAAYLNDAGLWRKLQALNRVRDPLALPPGSRLRVPVAWLRVQPAPARVVAVRGSVVAGREDEAGAAATVGTRLGPGDAIRVPAGGSATVEMADGSRVLVEPGSDLAFDTVSAFGATGMVDSRLRLQRGGVEVRAAAARGPASRFEIRTPAATSAVRGTRFRVRLGAETPVSRTEVTEGRVAVGGAKRTVEVPEGFGIVAAAGEAPGAPVRLLPAPDLARMPARYERVPLRLEIPPVAGAAGYRAEIAPDERFDVLLFSGTAASTTLRGPDLPDGRYTLRVRAIDGLDLEGLDGTAAIEVAARPEPPLLLQPAPGSRVREERPSLKWAEPAGAAGYRLQVARNDDFATPIVDEVVASATFGSTILPPGAYSWRVATRDAGGRTGPFGDPRGFERIDPPPAPALEPPQVEEGRIVIAWPAGAPGQKVRMQWAADPEFARLAWERDFDVSPAVLEAPGPGVHYLRVRTVDADGYLGPWGVAQRIEVPTPFPWGAVIVPALLLLLAL